MKVIILNLANRVALLIYDIPKDIRNGFSEAFVQENDSDF